MPYRRLRSLLDRPRRSWTGIALLGLALSSIAGGAANELAALGSAPRSEAPMASQETTHMIEKPTDRVAAAKTLVESVGGKMECFYWMHGHHDGFFIADYKDGMTPPMVSRPSPASCTTLLSPEPSRRPAA